MKNTNDIERLLESATAPKVVEGVHKDQLKAKLLQQIQEKQQTPGKWRSTASTRLAKVAAVFLGALILVATGWAAEGVYERVTGAFKKTPVFSETITTAKGKIALPDGREIFCGEGLFIGSIADPDSLEEFDVTLERLRQRHEEMKGLIAEGKYEFVKKYTGKDGDTQYIYRFTLSDGEQLGMNFSFPLEEVGSWEEYLQKVKEQGEQRYKVIQDAIADGRFRLINADAIKSHICVEQDTGEKIQVMQIVRPDGDKRALVSTHPIHESKDQYKMSWDDHLQAIVQGTRKLIDIRLTKTYTYEITLPDGSTRTWHYGGGGPIENPEE